MRQITPSLSVLVDLSQGFCARRAPEPGVYMTMGLVKRLAGPCAPWCALYANVFILCGFILGVTESASIASVANSRWRPAFVSPTLPTPLLRQRTSMVMRKLKMSTEDGKHKPIFHPFTKTQESTNAALQLLLSRRNAMSLAAAAALANSVRRQPANAQTAASKQGILMTSGSFL